MIRYVFAAGSLVFLAACSATPLARSGPDAQVRSHLEALFTACRDQDHRTAAARIVYRGDDPARRWRDVSNYDAEDEKQYVDAVCGEIRSLLAGSASFAWGAYFEEEESEGVWRIQAVQFVSGLQRQERHFAFLKIGDAFALGDID